MSNGLEELGVLKFEGADGVLVVGFVLFEAGYYSFQLSRDVPPKLYFVLVLVLLGLLLGHLRGDRLQLALELSGFLLLLFTLSLPLLLLLLRLLLESLALCLLVLRSVVVEFSGCFGWLLLLPLLNFLFLMFLFLMFLLVRLLGNLGSNLSHIVYLRHQLPKIFLPVFGDGLVAGKKLLGRLLQVLVGLLQRGILQF